MEHGVFVFDKEDRSTIFIFLVLQMWTLLSLAEGIKTEIEELPIQKMR